MSVWSEKAKSFMGSSVGDAVARVFRHGDTAGHSLQSTRGFSSEIKDIGWAGYRDKSQPHVRKGSVTGFT